MIDFSTLQGLTIPEGVVTEIKDVASGRVIWAVQNNVPVILQVEKITSDTYAGETTYTGEQFILLDIYPKTNGTVKVTYGGLTKTITDTSGAEEPNAQQVFFGNFNGVSDSVATPASGELTIEGGCYAFACGIFSYKKNYSKYCSCITDVMDWGNIINIPDHAFCGCKQLALTELPSGITSIGDYAFEVCTGIAIGEIPEGVVEIGVGAFMLAKDHNMPNEIVLPSTVTSIGGYAFCYKNNSHFYTIAKKIIIRATEPPVINGYHVFGSLEENSVGTIYGSIPDEIAVPLGCREAYLSAEYWSDYADIIVEAS